MKKAILPILMCLFIGTQSFQQTCNGKRLYPLKNSGDNGIYLNGRSYSYNAGDTIVLRASQNPYSYVTLEYFDKGTEACPLVIINEGGQVLLTNYGGDAIPGGFTFLSSQHVKLTGTGSGDQYGFKITTPNNRGVGINVYGRSAYFEIDHLDIYNKGCGTGINMKLIAIITSNFLIGYWPTLKYMIIIFITASRKACTSVQQIQTAQEA